MSQEIENIGFVTKLVIAAKNLFARDAYIFIATCVFCGIITFFVLDEQTGGGLVARTLLVVVLFLMGGMVGIARSKGNEKSVVKSTRQWAGGFLLVSTLLIWSNNERDRVNNSSNLLMNYPKSCKANCGYEMTSKTYDCDGYHCTCVPGPDGESAFEKASNL